ncbi:synaptobrevin-domain-containing protein [Gorgonomyces haynaldii]|nr:synaptobrevin-domain-containing protein [Gorgonomyces haynaldii]
MSKTGNVQNQVDEVVGIMQNNINKVMQRGEQLDSLQNKTEDLQQSSLQFKRGANQVRKDMWWKDMKLKLIIGGIVAIVIVIISILHNNSCCGHKKELVNVDVQKSVILM